MNTKTFITLITLLAVSVTVSSIGGILMDDMYIRETANWRAQSIAQDIVDLVLGVPLLLYAALSWRTGKRTSLFLLAGTLLFFLYTFIIYTFDVHFNRFFLLYCLSLGLTFYTLMYVILSLKHDELKNWFDTSKKATYATIFMYVVTFVFYFLWLSSIVPPMLRGEIPKELIEVGLPTNPVHIIDLVFFLPSLIIIAIMMKKGKWQAYFAAASFMVFSVVMALSIAGLIIYMELTGVGTGYGVAIAMFALALASGLVYRKLVEGMRT
jgi:hypothetical protein